MALFYDPDDRRDILRHARTLVGKRLADLYDDTVLTATSGKGTMGQLVQTVHFGLPADSRPAPDFEAAGVELKVTGLKRLVNGELRVKERLVLSLIDFETIVGETFRESGFLRKNALILLMCYLYENGVDVTELPFVLADYWDLIEEDLEQIERDWNMIVEKVRAGRAHELSEGDTLYLGACVKGPGGAVTMRRQPFSATPAPQRALSFKPVYLNYVVNELFNAVAEPAPQPAQALLADDEGRRGLEEVVLRRLSPFLGKTEAEIAAELGVSFSLREKARRARLVRHMLGVGGATAIAEFERAGIIIKTVPLNRHGRPAENMSFPAIDFVSLVDEDWEDSELRNLLVNKMLLIYFRSRGDGRCRLTDTRCTFDAVVFWHMPEVFLDTAVRSVWQDVVDKVRAGRYDELPKGSETGHVFVNTHAQTRDRDQTMTPQGRMEKKRSFWLHKRVLKSVYDQRTANAHADTNYRKE